MSEPIPLHELSRTTTTHSSRAPTFDAESQADLHPSPDTRELQVSAPNRNAASLAESQFAPELRVFELPPVDKGRQAWTFCACAFLLETMIWGYNQSYGIWQDYYSSHPPFSTSSSVAISLVGTVNIAIQYIEIIFAISIYQRYPEIAKRAMWIALFLSTAALVASSFANQTWQLILLQGVLFGLSGGFCYAPIIPWLSQWFVANRGLAGGIIWGGSGVGGFVIPLIVGSLLEKVGFRWTLRIWALLYGVTCSIAVFFIAPRIPARKPTADRPRTAWLPSDLSFLRSPLLILTLVTMTVQALGFFPVSIFMPSYTTSLSSSTLPATIALALFNAMAVIGNVAFGRFCDSYPYALIILVSAVISTFLAFLLWGFASSLGYVFAFAVLFGGFNGGFSGTWPAAAKAVAGERAEQTNLLMGCFSAVKGFAAIVGPLVAASLHSSSSVSNVRMSYGSFGFRSVQIFVGCMAVATSTCGVGLWFLRSSRQHGQS